VIYLFWLSFILCKLWTISQGLLSPKSKVRIGLKFFDPCLPVQPPSYPIFLLHLIFFPHFFILFPFPSTCSLFSAPSCSILPSPSQKPPGHTACGAFWALKSASGDKQYCIHPKRNSFHPLFRPLSPGTSCTRYRNRSHWNHWPFFCQ